MRGGKQTRLEGRLPAWSPLLAIFAPPKQIGRSRCPLGLRSARRLVLQPLQCIRHHSAGHRAQHRGRDQARRNADHKRGLFRERIRDFAGAKHVRYPNRGTHHTDNRLSDLSRFNDEKIAERSVQRGGKKRCDAEEIDERHQHSADHLHDEKGGKSVGRAVLEHRRPDREPTSATFTSISPRHRIGSEVQVSSVIDCTYCPTLKIRRRMPITWPNASSASQPLIPVISGWTFLKAAASSAGTDGSRVALTGCGAGIGDCVRKRCSVISRTSATGFQPSRQTNTRGESAMRASSGRSSDIGIGPRLSAHLPRRTTNPPCERPPAPAIS